MTLRAYMGYAGDPAEGACLIFAHTAKEAKPLAFQCCDAWFGSDYFAVRVRWLKGESEMHLFSEADPEKLAAGIAHAIDDVPVCPQCETWGFKRVEGRDYCEGCE